MKRWQLSVTGLCEALVVTCSDQQVFTGGAYAITLRYTRGCEISAYHYNIVANILLLTCATHLMSVAISRHYWEHPLVALLRVTVTVGVYLVTGIMLSNQGQDFPTQIPNANTTDSLMFMQAACFQNGTTNFATDLVQSVNSTTSAKNAFVDSQIGNKIQGWNQYLVMILFYGLAVLVGFGRYLQHGTKRDGKRAGVGRWAKKTCAPLFRLRFAFSCLFALYLIGGIAIASWTVVESAVYITGLRSWVNASGWLALSNGKNPEDDPTSFGQLVPLLLIGLTIFTMLQILSGESPLAPDSLPSPSLAPRLADSFLVSLFKQNG